MVLPEPINPARHKTCARGEVPRGGSEGGEFIEKDPPRDGEIVEAPEKLIALQDANCTTVGREFDFCEALAEGAEEALGEFGSDVLDAVGIRSQESGGLIVHGAHGGLGFQIEGIVAGEADFDEAFAAFHGVEAGADEIAIEENISRGRK